MKTLKVLIADDSQYMNLACKRILETQEHLVVVAMAADGEEAVARAQDLDPDVAVLDVRMPVSDGITASRQIIASRPGTGIVMMSNYNDPEYAVDFLRDGAEGKAYLLKASVHKVYELIRAVEAVSEGGTYLDPAIVDRLLQVHISTPSLSPPQPDARRVRGPALMAGPRPRRTRR